MQQNILSISPEISIVQQSKVQFQASQWNHILFSNNNKIFSIPCQETWW